MKSHYFLFFAWRWEFMYVYVCALLYLVRVSMVFLVLQSLQTLIYSIFFFGLISSPLFQITSAFLLPNATQDWDKKGRVREKDKQEEHKCEKKQVRE